MTGLPDNLSFRPVIIASVSVTAGLLWAFWGAWHQQGSALSHHLLYMTPIAVPFVAFVLERAEGLSKSGWPVGLLDVSVTGIALSRMFYPVPGISGHVLFLTYALFTLRYRVSRLFAALVLAQTLVLKVVFWHDYQTPPGGLLLGITGALLYHRLSARAK